VVSTVSPPFLEHEPVHDLAWQREGDDGWSGFQGVLYMMSVISPANCTGGWAFTYSYNVTIPGAGNPRYTCTYPGRAESGMYGEIITS
jgi:hypothetical protein